MLSIFLWREFCSRHYLWKGISSTELRNNGFPLRQSERLKLSWVPKGIVSRCLSKWESEWRRAKQREEDKKEQAEEARAMRNKGLKLRYLRYAYVNVRQLVLSWQLEVSLSKVAVGKVVPLAIRLNKTWDVNCLRQWCCAKRKSFWDSQY